MSSAIPDLWPDWLDVETVSPAAVLRTQEGLLSQRTQALVHGKLFGYETNGDTNLQFDLYVPGLRFYSERLLVATHPTGRPYPLVVTAACFADPRVAADAKEFAALIREVLDSEPVRAVIRDTLDRLGSRLAPPLSLPQETST